MPINFPPRFLDIMSRLAAYTSRSHRLYDVVFDKGDYDETGSSRVEVGHENDANAVASELADGSGLHTIMIDVDFPAHLLPSSTPGHHHLYVDIPPIAWEAYEKWLQASVDIGLIEEGYLKASQARKSTFLRLPWIRKGHPSDFE